MRFESDTITWSSCLDISVATSLMKKDDDQLGRNRRIFWSGVARMHRRLIGVCVGYMLWARTGCRSHPAMKHEQSNRYSFRSSVPGSSQRYVHGTHVSGRIGFPLERVARILDYWAKRVVGSQCQSGTLSGRLSCDLWSWHARPRCLGFARRCMKADAV